PDCRTICQFYAADYLPHQRKTRNPRWWRKLVKPFASKQHKRLPLKGAGKLLDFGCGSGTFLERMRRQGWEVTGLDVSSQAVTHARSHLGLRALQGTLPHPQLRHS